MSIRIWDEIADQKKQVENQRALILNAFKQRSVADQMGTLKAEKLFQPITKLLGKKEEKNEEEKEKFPDYAVAGEEINYMNELPFGEEVDEDPYEDLKPFTEEEMIVPATESEVGSDDEIIPLPEKSSPGPEEITPLPVPKELGDEVFPGEKQPPQSIPSYSEATKGDQPPKYKKPRADDSKDLSILTRLLKNNEGKPDVKIITKKSKFVGYTIDKAREKVYEIYTERAKKVLEQGDRKSAIGQKELGPYEGKSNEEMQAMIDEFEKGKKAQTGTGFNNLINRLSLGISSIIAGNTSIKLKKEIVAIAKLLHQKGVISKEQKNKVLSLK